MAFGSRAIGEASPDRSSEFGGRGPAVCTRFVADRPPGAVAMVGRMRTWGVVLGGVATLVVASCAGSGGSGSGDDSGAEPVGLVGETEQGLHLRIDLVGNREVSLRFPAVCGRDDQLGEDIAVSLHRHRFETGVDGDGSFTVDEAYVEDGTDGDEEHVEVRIEGDFSGDGTATGTLEVTSRWWNGQSADFSADCETGIVAWTADRPPVESNDMVVPTAVPMSLAPAGPDLLVSSGSGEVVRIDADTGDARRLDGSAPAGSTTTEADPNVPTTVATGAAAASAVAPIWLKNLAVVADGVWTVDPATGAVSRFELADGARTATIGHPLDSMAAGPDALWTVSTNPFRTSYALDKRDPATGDVLASTPVERGAIAVGPTDVWYADATLAGGRLARVDPTTLAVGEPFDVDIPVFGDDLVTTEDRVWWLDGRSLMAIQLASGRVSPVDLPSAPLAIAGDSTGVWTVHEQEAVARRIEGDRVVRTVDLPDGSWDVAVTSDGAVWLAGLGSAGDDPRIVRLDPAVTAS